MKRNFKKLVSLLLVFAMSLVISAPAFAASDTPPTLTVDKYISFLEEKSPENLDKFLALSSEEQQEFINLLLDPATYTISNNPKISRDYVSHNVRKSTQSDSKIAPKNSNMALTSSTSWDAWGTQEVSVYGIAILKYEIDVGYNVSNNKITSINYNDAYVVENLNPLVQTDTTSKDAWIDSSGNLVYATGIFYYKLGPIKDLSVQIGNIHGELKADTSGGASVSYWRDT